MLSTGMGMMVTSWVMAAWVRPTRTPASRVAVLRKKKCLARKVVSHAVPVTGSQALA